MAADLPLVALVLTGPARDPLLLAGVLAVTGALVVLAALDERRATGKPVTVVLVDIDGFKQVNDENGHTTADAGRLRLQAVTQEARRASARAALRAPCAS